MAIIQILISKMFIHHIEHQKWAGSKFIQEDLHMACKYQTLPFCLSQLIFHCMQCTECIQSQFPAGCQTWYAFSHFFGQLSALWIYGNKPSPHSPLHLWVWAILNQTFYLKFLLMMLQGLHSSPPPVFTGSSFIVRPQPSVFNFILGPLHHSFILYMTMHTVLIKEHIFGNFL